MSEVPGQPEPVESVSVEFAMEGAEGLTSAAQLVIVLQPISESHAFLDPHRTLDIWSGRSHSEQSYKEGLVLPVSIYLSDEETHEQVEAAVEAWLTAAHLQIVSRDVPVTGSWFRQMKATFSSPAAREAALVATHVMDAHLVLAQDAAVTMTLMQGIAPLLASLQPTKDAVVRLGAVLVVKVDWVVAVYQLTAAQQAILDHRPELASVPKDVLIALRLPSVDDADGPEVPPGAT
jgi:hypothetical protein